MQINISIILVLGYLATYTLISVVLKKFKPRKITEEAFKGNTYYWLSSILDVIVWLLTKVVQL